MEVFSIKLIASDDMHAKVVVGKVKKGSIYNVAIYWESQIETSVPRSEIRSVSYSLLLKRTDGHSG